MQHLSLRIRIFLFFCLAACGSLAITIAALFVGYRQLADPAAMSPFVTTGVIAAFGILGLVAGVWLLFDENVSKPVERIAASLRVRAHVDVSTPIAVSDARYLGDLAPAASALGTILDDVARSKSARSQDRINALEQQRDQLVEILSDVPVATLLMSAAHEIVLYDGQAAALMERVSPARLKTQIFDYFQRDAIVAALTTLQAQGGGRMDVAVQSHCDRTYVGHMRAFGRDGHYTLMLEPPEPVTARPLTFDFGLLSTARAASLGDTALRDLVYVVFDSETTGLDPVKDAVVQLGAVRVVNGRIVQGEDFDTLVDPGVPIPIRSTQVHGISTAMVAGAPRFDTVCADFRSFAADAVLVAHNAAFDMAFLQRQSPGAFDQPVLDTVLLSAAVFGGSAVHTLDAICDRLAITIPEDQRHTAMGDAIATAKALVAMIAMCEGRGITTFAALEAELRKHQRVLTPSTA